LLVGSKPFPYFKSLVLRSGFLADFVKVCDYAEN
jgi:hypothetical protein